MSRRLSRGARRYLLACVEEARQREAVMSLTVFVPLMVTVLDAAFRDFAERVLPAVHRALQDAFQVPAEHLRR